MKPTVPEVLPLVRTYMAKNEDGGALHLVLSDGNLGDASVRYCVEEARQQGDADALVLGELLLQMSRTQRRKLWLLGS